MKPVAVTFAGCFGWLHPAPGRRGAVLCSAWGQEALSAHRSWRLLAADLAAAGLPTLRFDYPGTGDSLGDPETPGRLRAWLDGIEAAVAWLGAATGVEEVMLAGLRLGGTLAAAAAAEMGGVGGLVMLAPPLSGGAYVRELKALAMLAPAIDGAPPPDPASLDLEAGGFVLTSETARDLEQLDLQKLGAAPASRALVLARPDSAQEAKLATRLRALGAAVEEAPFTGYAKLMRGVDLAQPPLQDMARIVAWMAEGASCRIPPAPPRLPPARLELEDPAAIEEPVQFGPGEALVGVLCRPAVPVPGRPVVVFLNMGANHHIGANRQSVTLARKLAGRGFPSLRMDVAGIGDSPARPGLPDNRLYDQAACLDLQAALDWLDERRFAHGFGPATVFGLCCGAYVGFHGAVRDERIHGLVMVNLQRFVWHEGDSLETAMRRSHRSTRFYLGMSRRARTWKRLLEGEIHLGAFLRMVAGRVRKRLAAKLGELSGGLLGHRSARRRVLDGFHVLAARGVRTLLLYSAEDGGLDELDLHLGQGGRKLRRLPNVGLRILEGTDHTFTTRWGRARLEAALLGFLLQPEPAPAAAPARARRQEPGIAL
jgi:pimeloyl-ACP methyl ester carboxylesterase